MRVHNASGLHVPRLKGLKESKIKISIGGEIKKIQTFQVAGKLCIVISVARTPSNTLQVRRIAKDAKEMIGTYLPKAQIGCSAVVNA